MIARATLPVLFAAMLAPSGTPAQDCTFVGTTRLNQATLPYMCATATFEPGATIVTDGYQLYIDAAQSIRLLGDAHLISFEARERPPGDDGRNAGLIYLRAPRIVGSSLEIRNRGEDGAQGAEGATGPTGARGHPGSAGSWEPEPGGWTCVGAMNGGNGRTGGRGGDGGPGGAGGAGGAVYLEIVAGCPEVRLVLDTSGGRPGNGGAGGKGGAGGPPGRGGSARPPCAATDPGETGPPGPEGGSGPTGASGPGAGCMDLTGGACRPECTQPPPDILGAIHDQLTRRAR